MTDVLIVCVREDERQAKALADMFEGAGFAVGGAPTDDASLRKCAAVVVIWSQASIRSRPFLDAAQRVVNAGKGVIASLIDMPPSSSLNQSPAFDLRGWRGDPEDPALDPLFFTVDRMASEAGITPMPVAEPEPAPPPARPYAHPAYPRSQLSPSRAPEPEYDEAPAPRRRAAPIAPGNDPMSAEALRWRAIRHSRDAAAFLHYLAEYGPDGAFSELAELRLKQLQDSNATPLRAAARAASQPARGREPPPPARREPAAAPPRRAERYDHYEERAPAPPPVRREPPPAPRYEREPERAAAPAPRREAPATPIRFDDERRDYAPPPLPPERRSNGGGAIRMLVLFLLLGGGAIGAGMYFGVGAQFGQEQSAGASTTPPPSETAEAAAVPLEDPAPSVNPETAIGGPTLTEETAFDRPAAAAPRAAASRPEPRSEPVRAPRFEPVEQANDALQLMPQPMAPPPRQVASLEAVPPAAIVRQANVVWQTRANANQFASAYPTNAQDQGLGGRVMLSCMIGVDYRAACRVVSETPAGLGFGDAAMRVSRAYRARPTLEDGASSVGARAALNIQFRPAAE